MEHYQGGCHCGAVRYAVELELKQAIRCNCSICEKQGALRLFAPASQFKLLQWADSLSDYQFNQRVIHHLFCKTCGISSFSRGLGPQGQEMVSINARCLDGIDLDQLPLYDYDGKTR